jgi:hypothetical protein
MTEKPPVKESNDAVEVRSAQSTALSKSIAENGIQDRAATMRAANQDPAVAAKRSEVLKTIYEDPAKRIQSGERLKAAWASMTPEQRETSLANMKAAAQSPERNAKLSQAVRQRYEDPAVLARHRDIMREVGNRPETSAKKSQSLKEFYTANPEAKIRISERARNPANLENLARLSKMINENPELSAKRSAGLAVANRKRWDDPEKRKQMSEKMKAIAASPEERKKRSERMKAFRAAQRAQKNNVRPA